MPVVRMRTHIWKAPKSREEMIAQILGELLGSTTEKPSPVIFEIPVNEGRSFHIIVVWTLWKEVPLNVRASMVAKAYKEFDLAGSSSEPKASRIPIAIGATPKEALIDLGLLPYRIGGPTICRRGDQMDGMTVPDSSVQAGIEAVGGFEWDGKYYLAYPTEEMADEAFEILSREHPGHGWQRADLV